MEYFLSFRTFEQLVDCPESRVCPEFTVLNIYIYLIIQNFEQLAHALKFFTALKYFYLSGFLRNLRFP